MHTDLVALTPLIQIHSSLVLHSCFFYVTQELLSQATNRQPALLQHLRLTLKQLAGDQSSTMGQLLRDGPKADLAASAALLQVVAGIGTPVASEYAIPHLSVGNQTLHGSQRTRGVLLQGFTMLAELKGADGGGADLIPEALRTSLPNR
jgi:hypothetical protein